MTRRVRDCSRLVKAEKPWSVKAKAWRCSDWSLWGVKTGSVGPAPVVREGEGMEVQRLKPAGCENRKCGASTSDP